MITASDIIAIKNSITTEMTRRNLTAYTGSDYLFNDTDTPTSQGEVTHGQGIKLIEPVYAVNSSASVVSDISSVSDIAKGNELPKIMSGTNLSDYVTQLAAYSVTGDTTGCSGACTGLCYTDCYSECSSGGSTCSDCNTEDTCEICDSGPKVDCTYCDNSADCASCDGTTTSDCATCDTVVLEDYTCTECDMSCNYSGGSCSGCDMDCLESGSGCMLCDMTCSEESLYSDYSV